MRTVLLTASRVLLAVFLIGGIAVTLGQTIGIVTGSGPLVEVFGTSVADAACVTAGIASVLAYLLVYTGEKIQDD
ncbi:hypothetical protein ALI144C_50915 [Actinosynnema sp. ALI-1.44]|uniref:hypothetical protein n=1 Tax=Actinosynnema sp. ALI-1.44 TaxID=1933779 RepID=UPI00097C5B1E|nr:hypothetical protein [Actinosynnema sp. ALI-1.44]ONI71315.1 hypothetical protein ALI144C_50915 [Actinosynnema sp. ALI-1.44]